MFNRIVDCFDPRTRNDPSALPAYVSLLFAGGVQRIACFRTRSRTAEQMEDDLTRLKMFDLRIALSDISVIFPSDGVRHEYDLPIRSRIVSSTVMVRLGMARCLKSIVIESCSARVWKTTPRYEISAKMFVTAFLKTKAYESRFYLKYNLAIDNLEVMRSQPGMPY